MDGKLFIDGSIDCDLPKERLSQLFNVTCFIVSQVNPFVLMFIQKERRHRSILRK